MADPRFLSQAELERLRRRAWVWCASGGGSGGGGSGGGGGGDGGGGAPVSARYWRLFIETNTGDPTFVGAGEIEFRETAGGADAVPVQVANNANILFSAHAAGNDSYKAFDNNGNSGWATGGGQVTNQYIGYDFGAGVQKAIVEVAMKPSGSAGVGFTRMPRVFRLQYSDNGTTWTDKASYDAGLVWVDDIMRTFPEAAPAAGFHRAWRLFCYNNNGGSTWILLDEIEYKATPGGAKQTPFCNQDNMGALGRAIATAGDNSPWRCYDGGTADYWYGVGVTNRYNGFVFPAAVKVEELALFGNSQTARNPKDFDLQYSDDGVTWTTQKSFTGITWSGVTKVLAAI